MSDTNGLSTDSDGLRGYHKMVAERAQHASALVAELKGMLADLGVARISAEYDGCGDSGQIESIEYRNAANAECEVPKEVEEKVDQLLYDLLEVRHGGWENNDGAFGSFTWNLADDTLEHEHNARFTDHDTSTYSGFGGLFSQAEGS